MTAAHDLQVTLDLDLLLFIYFTFISARFEALWRNGPDSAGVSRRSSSTQIELQLEHGF